MPSPRLLHRVGNLHLSPVWEKVPAAEQDAFNARVIAAEDFADLSEDDKALVRRGELAVSNGESASLINPADWGDWAAIDAAIDSGDEAALDRALETVGSGDGGNQAAGAAPGDDDVDPDAGPDDGVELDDDGFAIEDGRESKAGWVGL